MSGVNLYNRNLHVVSCSNQHILYDTNRVKTYSCTPVEAGLINGENSIDISSRVSLASCDRQTLENAKKRLHRLSGLSDAHANKSCGVGRLYNGYPTYLYLNLCDACNLNCVYCCADTRAAQSDTLFMSVKTALSSIDFLFGQARSGECYTISFAGGEPLLNFEVLAPAVAYARNRSRQLGVLLRLNILTNGTVMNPEILEFIAGNQVDLQISLDGPPEFHNRLRPTQNGNGSLNKVIETIEFLERHKFTGYRVRSTVCHANCDLSSIDRFVRQLGIKRFTFRPIMTTEKDPYRIDRSDLSKITAYFDQISETFINQIHAGLPSDIPEPFNLYFIRLKTGVKTKRYCGADREMVVVTPGGWLYSCPVLVGDESFRTGSLEQGFSDWRKTRFFNLSVDQKTVCSGCWARNLCGGGCAAQALRLNGDIQKPDPLECVITREKIKSAIAIHTRLKTNLQ